MVSQQPHQPQQPWSQPHTMNRNNEPYNPLTFTADIRTQGHANPMSSDGRPVFPSVGGLNRPAVRSAPAPMQPAPPLSLPPGIMATDDLAFLVGQGLLTRTRQGQGQGQGQGDVTDHSRSMGMRGGRR
jgi:hypothetical protein